MIYLVFCLVFAFILRLMVQGVPHSEFGCLKDIDGYEDNCRSSSHYRYVQVKTYGVDCCIEEVRDNIKSFSRISIDISKELNAINVTVSYPKINVNIIFSVIADRYIAKGMYFRSFKFNSSK